MVRSPGGWRWSAVVATGVALWVAALGAPGLAIGAPGPADQPPFGGEPLPQRIAVPSRDQPPPGFRLSAREALDLANATGEVRSELAKRDLDAAVAARADGRWEITYRDDEGTPRALVVLEGDDGEVVEAWTGHQVETKLARGYEDAVAGDVSEAWIWLPLCALFVLPFFDPRRPFRLLHLDLLALLAFGVSQFFFNKGEIEASVTLVYPVLGYVFVRMLVAGFRPRRRQEPLVPFARPGLLAAGIALLVVFRVGLAVEEVKVIDVGLAGVVGADRLVEGEEVYGEGSSDGLPIRGDVYGPANYLAYVPFEQLFPWSGEWDDVPAARAAALGFDLLTALVLFALGLRLRGGAGGRMLGLALAFAWLAYPYAAYTLGSSFNDSLVALTVTGSLLVLTLPPVRGAVIAFSGLTKFGSLALGPLFAAGRGDRRPRTVLAFLVGFTAIAALVTAPLLPEGGLREAYDRSLGYQASRGSPFSVWGLDPSLEPLQTVAKVLAVGFAVALFFYPRHRSTTQVAALAAATLIAVQVAATHWFYPYTVWFAPLVLVAVFAAHWGPGGGEARPQPPTARRPQPEERSDRPPGRRPSDAPDTPHRAGDRPWPASPRPGGRSSWRPPPPAP
jgi:hypothetical protein